MVLKDLSFFLKLLNNKNQNIFMVLNLTLKLKFPSSKLKIRAALWRITFLCICLDNAKMLRKYHLHQFFRLWLPTSSS